MRGATVINNFQKPQNIPVATTGMFSPLAKNNAVQAPTVGVRGVLSAKGKNSAPRGKKN